MYALHQRSVTLNEPYLWKFNFENSWELYLPDPTELLKAKTLTWSTLPVISTGKFCFDKTNDEPLHIRIQWRIQDFPQGGAPTPKIAIIFQFFSENCVKMKEFGPRGGGRGASLAPPPLDPPMAYFM